MSTAEIDVYKEWLGIPEGERPPDHYQLLRLVQFEDAPEKVRANYKKLNAHVRKYATGQYSVRSQDLLNELARAMLCLTDAERKKEYDESLGREFEETTAGGRKPMEAVLVEQKHISSSQLKEARDHAERSGLSLRDSLVQLKMVDAVVAAQALSQELGIPYVDLADMLPDDDVLDMVPRSLAKQQSLLPLFEDNGVVLVACIDQFSHEVEEELRLRFEMPVRVVLASPHSINQAISKHYAPGLRKEPAAAVKKTSGNQKAAAAQRPVRKSGPATEEEIKEKRSIGIIILNASFLVSYLLDNFVVTPGIFFDAYTFLIFLTIPPITGFLVWQNFWKR